MSKLYLSEIDWSQVKWMGNASKAPQIIVKGNVTYNLLGKYSVVAKHDRLIKFKAYLAIIFSLGLMYSSEKVREARKGRKIKIVYLKENKGINLSNSEKSAKKIESISEKKSSKSSSISSVSEEDSLNNEKILQVAFAKCKNAYLNIENSPDQFIKLCSELSSLITAEEEDEALLSEILNFKNEVRAACLPANEKALKGPCSYTKIDLKQQDQDILRIELKQIREAILKKHFKIRLEKDEKKLNQLNARWITLKTSKSSVQVKCVEIQLKRWSKKHKEGKPIAFPKWFHLTKSEVIQQLILESEVLYKSEALPGAFVANYPVKSYGKFGLAFSSYIEETAIKDPIDGILYPKYSHLVDHQYICYADEEQPVAYYSGKPEVWFGFQRGKKAHYNSNAEKIGIPLYRKKIVESKDALNYYRDTSIAFLFNHYNPDLYNSVKGNETEGSKVFALANRVQILNEMEEESISDFISNTFALTFPKGWKGKLNGDFSS